MIKKYLLSFLISLLFVQGELKAQLVADFFADKVQGCDMMFVQFTDASVGENVEYNWDFGNGTSSTLQNPQVYYSEAGKYTVRLIITSGALADTLTMPNYINVNKGPKATFSADVTEACAPLTSNFISNVTLGDTTIANYIWDFNDGVFSNNENPNHTFSEDRKYSISLFVVDDNGCEDIVLKSNYISAVGSPKVAFDASNTIACFDTNTVYFSNNTSSELAVTYLWDFGDGSTSNLEHPQHLYSGFGNYDVILQVENSFGCSSELIKTNQVQMQAINANFSLPNDSLCRDLPVSIENNSLGATSFSWDFGDGSTSSLVQPIKTFNQAGDFTIRLVASLGSYCTDTLEQQVWVDPVEASFGSDLNYSCEVPFDVAYINNSQHAASYQWLFGNGMQSTQANPEITYQSTLALEATHAVNYSDTLIAISEFGCESKYVLTDNVSIVLPTIQFVQGNTTSGPFGGCVPLNIDFVNTSVNNNPEESFVSYTWDFGDGNTATSLNASHAFTEAGDFEASLTVTNSMGCVNSYTQTIFAGNKQNPNFKIDGAYSRCGSESVLFNNLSSDVTKIDNYAWVFSDSTKSVLQNPNLSFSDTGYIKAQLTVEYNYCKSDPEVKDSIVYIEGPTGNFYHYFDCTKPREYNFLSSVVGADSIFWDFGDGSYDSTQTSLVNKVYDASGDYTVKVYALNNTTDCVLNLSANVNARALKSVIDVDTNIVCKEDGVLLSAKKSEDYTNFFYNGGSYQFLWHINGDTTIAENNDFRHRFASSGVNNVRLQVSDANGCTDDTTIQVKVFKPNVDFSVDVAQGCTPLIAELSDLTTSDTTLDSWQWFLNGDEVGSSSIIELTHADTGYATVGLLVRDVLGCETTLTKPNFLYSSRPQPHILVESIEHCFGDSMSLNNQSKGVNLSQTWFMGDGMQSELAAFKYQYSAPGKYELSIYQEDLYGCDTTWVLPDSIFVEALPLANFTAETRTFSCYPALLQFEDQSMGNVSSWLWEFGDATTPGYSENPYHTYLLPHEYSVKLSVATALGCAHDTVFENYINVKGPYAEVVAPDSACVNRGYNLSLTDIRNLHSSFWFFNDGSSALGTTASVNYADFGTENFFLLLKTDTLGTCDKVINDSIIVPTLLADFSVADSQGCVPLLPEVSNTSIGAVQYNWYLNTDYYSSNFEPIVNVSTAGNYPLRLVASSSIGCIDSSAIPLEVYPLPEIKMSSDTLICVFDTISLWASGGEDYLWQNGANIINPEDATPRVYPNNNTYYTVAVTDSNACVNLDSVQVLVQPVPIVEIQDVEQQALIIGEELSLDAQVQFAEHYTWSPEAYFSCENCLNTYSKPLETGYLVLSAYDNYNCFVVNDSVFIEVDKKYSVDLPNAFTPNSDGTNDVVWVKGWGIENLLLFEVYNKYGKKVYQSSDISRGWDGKMDGNALSPDVYYYQVQVQFYDGEIKTKSGEIYLLN